MVVGPVPATPYQDYQVDPYHLFNISEQYPSQKQSTAEESQELLTFEEQRVVFDSWWSTQERRGVQIISELLDTMRVAAESSQYRVLISLGPKDLFFGSGSIMNMDTFQYYCQTVEPASAERQILRALGPAYRVVVKWAQEQGFKVSAKFIEDRVIGLIISWDFRETTDDSK